MDEVVDGLAAVLGLGLESRDIDVGQMALRAAVVYIVTVFIVRVAKKRFMGRATAFDVILGIMLGSIVSRAVTGNAPFLPALAAAAVLVAMHAAFSWTALKWHGFGRLVKGRSVQLVRDGVVDWRHMAKSHMTEHDLREDLRIKGVADPKQASEVRLERSGQVSVIEAPSEPKVLEVHVADGVQTVRIELAR